MIMNASEKLFFSVRANCVILEVSRAVIILFTLSKPLGFDL